MKNIYYIFFFLLFTGCTKKTEIYSDGTSSKDSLASYLSLANDDRLSLSQKLNYNQKALNILINGPNDSVNKVNLFRVANRYYNMNDWKAYKKTVYIVLENAISSKDSINMAKGYTYLGDYYGAQSVSDSAFIYYSKANKIYGHLNDDYNLAKTLLNKALLQYKESDFSGSEIAVFNALRVAKEVKAKDVLYDSYNLLGIVYNEREEYIKAIEFHNKAFNTLESMGDEGIIPQEFQSKATSFNNIGFVYLNLQEYKKAKDYFEKGLAQENLFRDKPSLYAMILENFAYSKFKLKEFKGLPDLFFKSLRVRDSLQLSAGIIVNKIHLSEYFASKKDTAKAMQFAKQALATARMSKNYQDVLASLNQLVIIEPKKASIYSKEYILINDSLQKAERKMGDKFARIEYETDEIKNVNNELAQQNRNLVYFFSGLGILGLLIFKIKSQKAKNRELLFKQQQQVANEEIYNLMISQQNAIEVSRVEEKKRVARELHDGVLGRMFGVRMNLDGLNKQQDESAILQRINYLAELKNIEQDIREISHDLNREKSELINNFVAIVNNLFEEQKKTYKSKFIVNIDATIRWELVSNAVKINLYRIIQEILQNTNKYAEALKINVDLKKEEDHLVLRISDDGKGFNVKTAKKGIGLQNILFRTNECEGVVDIKSAKLQGTTVTVTLPIA